MQANIMSSRVIDRCAADILITLTPNHHSFGTIPSSFDLLSVTEADYSTPIAEDLSSIQFHYSR